MLRSFAIAFSVLALAASASVGHAPVSSALVNLAASRPRHIVASGGVAPARALPVVRPNANTARAGVLRDGVLDRCARGEGERVAAQWARAPADDDRGVLGTRQAAAPARAARARSSRDGDPRLGAELARRPAHLLASGGDPRRARSVQRDGFRRRRTWRGWTADDEGVRARQLHLPGHDATRNEQGVEARRPPRRRAGG